MKIAILKTDAVRPEWVPTYGEYPDMFQRLLHQVDPTIEFEVWDVEKGEFPERTDQVDAFLITGSKSSVYDDKPWIRELEAFVRRLRDEGCKVIGICFGHQMIARALGGRVEKSDKGWGVGIHQYRITDDSLQDGEGGSFRLLASHQDQVLALPPDARVVAENEHCEIAAFKVGEQLLAFQGHPEFIPEYSREIMEFRKALIGATRVTEGMASLENNTHEGERVARWMLDFVRGQSGD